MMEKYVEAEKAIAEAEKINPNSLSVKHHRALILAAKGEKDEALNLIEGAEESYGYLITCVYSLLGMKNEAIENIKKGIKFGFKEVQNHLYSYLLLRENLGYYKLHNDPRFKEILKSQEEIYDQRIRTLRDLL